LLNAVTEYVDHERRARSTNTAWTRPGSARCADQTTRTERRTATRRLAPLTYSTIKAPGQLLLAGRFYAAQENIMETQTLQQPSSKPRPALRLVGTKQLPREDWLAVRKQGIGSSDAAAAVG
jgi:hypothetical protein